MSDKYYLAVHCGHNGSCAFMRNGKIVYAAQEERFTRTKNDVGYPKRAIDYGIEKLGIRGADISKAAYTTKDFYSVFIKAKHTTNFSIRDFYDFYGEKYYYRKLKGEDCLDYLKWLRDEGRFKRSDEHFDFSYLTDRVLLDSVEDSRLFREERVRLMAIHLGMPKERIVSLDHHTCHAYYAYFGSPFRGDDCIVVTLDSRGDGRNETVWKVSHDKLELLAESDENGISHIYKMATLLLGMRPDEHEYKVMGLAPYSKTQYSQRSLDVIKNIIEVKGLRIVNKNRPDDLFTFLKNGWEGHRFDNIAGAVQLYAEMIAKQLIESIYKQTGITKFVLSGGTSLNVKMNKAIADMPFLSSVFVCASGGDESLSIGGCYYLSRDEGKSEPLSNVYLGFDVRDEIKKLDTWPLKAKYDVRTGVTNKEVAGLLAKGDIVARVSGRAEFGARALGNRSILADPSKLGAVRKINEAIKNRDFWMPFAVSMLEDHADRYVKNPKKLSSPFMTLAFDTIAGTYDEIKAGTHPYDHTARPQFVSKKESPGYYDLIDEFYKLTGIAAVLNTSFNLHGEPICNDIADSIRTFELSGLDHLLIEDTLISKKGIK